MKGVPAGIAVVAAVATLIAGVGIGWVLRGPYDAPAQEVVVVHDVVDGDGGGPASASVPSIEDPASTCPTELALLRAAYNSLEAEAIGEPETFPADLDPAYTPDGVRAAVDELVAACPELGLTHPWVDCEEYPCQVWFERSTDVGGFDSNGLSRCKAWVERMGQGGYGVSNGSLMRDGQAVRYLSYHLRQPDPKRKSISAFRLLNYTTIATGDSYNDTTMLGAADAG